MCAATLGGGPLICQLDAGHDHGHVFVSAWAADRVEREGGGSDE